MALGADVSQLQDEVTSELALNREVVLRGVLGAHLGLEIAEEQHRTEACPILRRTARGAENSGEGIRIDRSILTDERGVQKRRGQKRAATEWRFCPELLKNQLLHRVVEQAPSGANAGFTIRAE